MFDRTPERGTPGSAALRTGRLRLSRGRLVLVGLLVALASSLFANEFEDLADKYLERGRYDQALAYYRKAIAASPRRDSLWEKYDSALTASLIARGVLAKPIVGEPATPTRTVAVPATPVVSAAAAPAQPAPAPVPPPPPPAPLPAPAPAIAARRPGERIPMADPSNAAQSLSDEVIDGGWYRVENVHVEALRSGRFRLTGRLVNSGEQPINRPIVYASLFDVQGGLRAHAAGNLAHGSYYLGAGSSENFEVMLIPNAILELAYFNVEVVATR